MARTSYHHGDLKAVILAQAAALVAERGADGISLRELARAAGVSHAAPAHHFTDRRGLFTALAAEGWRLLAAALKDARPDFIDAALAYVRFAIDHPGHYAVMFDRSLINREDPELIAAVGAAGSELAQGVGTLDDARATKDPQAAALAAWSLVHGFSLLWLNKAIDNDTDPIATVHRVAGMLFKSE
ncbi:TetR/AcrR family transcriptional regulator [Mycobacterium deserti]|uniref:TetR/AcrR family transcriptional regulator n=1 Tax=Mycobacterium deserti TaxID=2978347 RepID=A0ABT2M7X3_9MYCO|nr:TetR/AcrR family transcriptional regulator [Mycobacterium deserti]MCT7657699.1 TetR/AcrR family transcriptional regulator [Mycobacterium deserti]